MISNQDHKQHSPNLSFFTPAAGFRRGSTEMPGSVRESFSFSKGPLCSNKLCLRPTTETCMGCKIHYCSKNCMIIGYANHLRDCIFVPPNTMDIQDVIQPYMNSYQQPMPNDSLVRRGNETSTKVTESSAESGNKQSTKRKQESMNFDNTNNEFNNNGHSESEQEYEKRRRLNYLKVGDIFNMLIMELDIRDTNCDKDIIAIKVFDHEPIYQNLSNTLSEKVIDEKVETLKIGKVYVCQRKLQWVRVYVINIYNNMVLVRYLDLKNSVHKIHKDIIRECPWQCKSFPPAIKRARFVDGTSKDVLRKWFQEGKILQVEVVNTNRNTVLSLKLLQNDAIERLNVTQPSSDAKQDNRGRHFSKENFDGEEQTHSNQYYESSDQNMSKKHQPNLDNWDNGDLADSDKENALKNNHTVRNSISSKKSDQVAFDQGSSDGFSGPSVSTPTPTLSLSQPISSTTVQSSNQNKLSMKLAGEVHEVIVSSLCSDDPTCFYAVDDPSIMKTLTEELDTIDPSQFNDITNPIIGVECLSNNNGGWYRGRVVELNPMKIFYIDYGNTETVNTILKKVPKDLVMNRFPPQAKKVKLEAGNVKQLGIDVYSQVKIKIVRREDEFIVASAGETKEVLVFFRNHKDHDKVHVIPVGVDDKIREIAELPQSPLKNLPSIGSLVLCSYNEDFLVRAQILGTDPLVVGFIDYGGWIEVRESDLFELSGPWSKEPPLSFLVPAVERTFDEEYECIYVMKKIGQDEWQFLL